MGHDAQMSGGGVRPPLAFAYDAAENKTRDEQERTHMETQEEEKRVGAAEGGRESGTTNFEERT